MSVARPSTAHRLRLQAIAPVCLLVCAAIALAILLATRGARVPGSDRSDPAASLVEKMCREQAAEIRDIARAIELASARFPGLVQSYAKVAPLLASGDAQPAAGAAPAVAPSEDARGLEDEASSGAREPEPFEFLPVVSPFEVAAVSEEGVCAVVRPAVRPMAAPALSLTDNWTARESVLELLHLSLLKRQLRRAFVAGKIADGDYVSCFSAAALEAFFLDRARNGRSRSGFSVERAGETSDASRVVDLAPLRSSRSFERLSRRIAALRSSLGRKGYFPNLFVDEKVADE